MQTIGISRKVIDTVVGFLVAWAATHYGLSIDPELQVAIAGVIAAALGIRAPASAVAYTAELPGGITDEQRAALPKTRRRAVKP